MSRAVFDGFMCWTILAVKPRQRLFDAAHEKHGARVADRVGLTAECLHLAN